MATLKDALVDLKGVLETGVGATNFQGQVTIWDYSILDNALPRAIVLRPSTVVEDIDTYGDRWIRRLQINCEIHVHYEVADSAASSKRLLDALEDFDTILIDNFHLGKTIDDYQSARSIRITQAKTLTRAESSMTWFGAIIVVMVDIVKQASAAAQ